MVETLLEEQSMVTRFQLIDRTGNTVARGEIDGDIHRVFSDALLGGCQEFRDTTEVFAVFPGCAIQPELFESAADTRQLGLFQKE